MPTDAFSNSQLGFLTERQLAKLICQSVRTIQKWRVTGHGPAFHKFGQSVRYNLTDVQDWITRRRFAHTSNFPRSS